MSSRRRGLRLRAVRLRAVRPRWASRPTAAELTYGGELFARASTFVRARAAVRPESDVDAAAVGAERPHAWLVDLGGVVALTRLAANLPRLDVRLTGSDAGTAIGRALAGRTFGVPRNRLCAAVFSVPLSVPDRPSGKRNQALRTALTAAARSGVEVRRVASATERSGLAAVAVRQVPRLASWSQTSLRRTDLDWWVAEDGRGELVGIATVVVDAEWASLTTLVGIPGTAMESNARYVLHHAIVQWLSGAGVGHLTVLDHSPLLLDPGLQHLQRVLGYRPVRLRRPTPVVVPCGAAAVDPAAVVAPDRRVSAAGQEPASTSPARS